MYDTKWNGFHDICDEVSNGQCQIKHFMQQSCWQAQTKELAVNAHQDFYIYPKYPDKYFSYLSTKMYVVGTH